MNCHQLRQVFQYRLKKWNKRIWIAKQIPNEVDDYGRAKYEKPECFEMNVQPISSSNDMQEFGENAKQIQRAVIEYDKYFDKFSQYDLAYLDGATPNGETINGSNANYRLLPPRNQNKVILLYFERLTAK